MAAVLTEKKVLFAGIWKPSPKAAHDALLRQISTQFLRKKSLVATYQLCADGLRLQVIQDNGKQGPRSEKIPLSSIQDICANINNPVCLMTIFVDSQRRSNYLVCQCESERDASQIVLTFREHKKSLIGEGYKIDLVKPQGKNWTLMPKENQVNGTSSPRSSESSDVFTEQVKVISQNGDMNGYVYGSHQVSVEMQTETFDREPCEIEGKQGFSVGVQTQFGEHDSDMESVRSSASIRSLKDELLSLSQEIREIKFMLEKTTGISAAEYFKKDASEDKLDGKGFVPIPVEEQDLPSPNDSINGGEKRVNFSTMIALPDHDARSFGVQTERGRKGYYTKRQGRSDVRNFTAYKDKSRHRSSSSNSVPRSPGSLGRAGGHDVFDMSGSQRVHIRGTDSRRTPGGTIERPIEQVYNVYSRNFHQPQKKIVVMPGSHSMRRPKSSSQSSSLNNFDDHYPQ